MAEWKQQKLGNPKILEDIGKRADQAIEAVNTAMGVIKTGGEVAQLVLLSSMNPVLLAMKSVGEAIVDMANNYREAGFYVLLVGYGDGSTAKEFEDYGLAQLRDKDGNFLIQNAYYKVTGKNSVGEAAFEVYRNYPVDTTTEPKFVKSLNKIGYCFFSKKKSFLAKIIKAFQRHYRQELINGHIDKECLIIAQNLLKKL